MKVPCKILHNFDKYLVNSENQSLIAGKVSHVLRCILPLQCCICCWAGCVSVLCALACLDLGLSFAGSPLSTATLARRPLHNSTHKHMLPLTWTYNTLAAVESGRKEPCPLGSPPPLGSLPVWLPPPAVQARPVLRCGTVQAPWLTLPSVDADVASLK